MAPTSQTEIEALGGIVAGALIAVIAAIVILIRNGRTVPLPGIKWRSRLPRRDPRTPRGRKTSRAHRGSREGAPSRPAGQREFTQR